MKTGRIPIADIRPLVSCGRFPARAVEGETVVVSAAVFREGHDAVAASLVLIDPDGATTTTRMRPLGNSTDRWEAEATFTRPGRWTYAIEGWGDPWATWRHDAEIKIPLGQDVELMCEEGARLLDRAREVVPDGHEGIIDAAVWALRDGAQAGPDRLAAATSPVVVEMMERHPVREPVTRSDELIMWVDRERALYGAWYEFFPRSEGAWADEEGHWHSGTLRSAMERLPAVAAMGFDVVYLPPVHPIGHSYRKGRNNTLTPAPDDPGSPWAIGSEAGGHDAVHPDLGTIEDFDAFVARTRELGMEVALDYALQASPDHPWVTEHPEWFSIRADGSIAYAENPPKKYQDIYPINFDRDPEGIYTECLRVLRHWMDHGVRIFRVDNPHTKPVNFWEWLIAEAKRSDPDVLFLAEAFTRPAMMHELAKIGFTQSYTYFTWRTAKWEIEEYARELSGPVADYMRPNFFVNTPDILHASLQYGGPPMFKIRAVLAALLAPSYGVYSGYELFEHVAVRPGSEEYLDSEKYQYRPRDWAAAEREGRTLAPYLTRLNDVRRTHPALHRLKNLRFHSADSDAISVWSKTHGEDTVLVVVNLDPHAVREATVHLDMPALGMDWADRFEVHDEITGATYNWGESSFVRLDPFGEPAHVFTVRAPGAGA